MAKTLKQEILVGPVIKRPHPNRHFYLRRDWSCYAQEAVLLQVGCSKKEEEAIHREILGGKFKFKKGLDGLRLRPIAFISQHQTEKTS